MSVSKYDNTNCVYRYDRLTKEVYLINENALRDIHIDDMAAYVDGITQEPLVFHAYNMNLQDTDSLDERYEFSHQITFSINGYANYRDFLNRYYVIVKSVEGVYWLCNPLFPCKCTFTYTLDFNSSHTDFTLNTVSNHPLLRLVGFDGGRNYECKNYDLSSFKSLRLNEKQYCMRDESNVIYTNSGFKEIVFQKNSQVFTENFDGENVQHTITFDIDFDDYKSSWHYNLLEFTDNLYSAIIQNWNGDYLLCGFGFGLQPSYTVTATDEQQPNKIEIVLSDLHDNGDFVYVTSSATINHDTNTIWVYDETVVECNGNIGRYLLKKEIDAIGNPTGKYQCLEGYEEAFEYLDIVGTFEETYEFDAPQCHEEACQLMTSIPSLIEFNDVGTYNYSFQCDTDWTITNNSSLTIVPTSGEAGISYFFGVTNNTTPTNTPIQGSFTINYCGNQTRVINTVISLKNDCFYGGDAYTISPIGQYVKVPIGCDVLSIVDSSGIITETETGDGYISVYVPQNDTGSVRQITLEVEIDGGGTTYVYITQTQIFETWVSVGSQCYYGERCDIYRRYTGTTSTAIDQPTNDYKTENCQTSNECGNVWTRWIENGETVCNGGKLYKIEQQQISYDNETWTYTSNKRQGERIEDSQHECTTPIIEEQWLVVSGYVCDGTTMYAKERLYRKDDTGVWYPTDIYRKSDVIIEEDSPSCGYEPTWRWEKWFVIQDEYLCNDGNKYEYKRKYVSNDDVETIEEVTNWTPTDIFEMGDLIEAQSTDCGYDPSITGNCTTYIDNGDTVCDGVNKYQYLRKYVRECVDCNDCSAEWIPTDEYLKGELIQADSLDCGYIPSGEYTQWRESGTQCDGYDLYQVYTKWISDDNVQWYETTITKLGDEPIEEDSDDCGYEPIVEYEYQWILTTETQCQGFDKMFLFKKQRRIKNSQTEWQDVIPTEYSIDGDGTMTPQVAEADSEDCGYSPIIEPIYKWEPVVGDYICDFCDEIIGEKWIIRSVYCDGVNKYAIEELFQTEDNVNFYPTGQERSMLIETDSVDCGGENQYREITTATTCVGVDKYWLTEYQVSNDSGATWETTGTSATTLIEANSVDCGYATREVTTATTCVGVDKYWLTEYQVSCDSGDTWETTSSSATTLIEANSADCGYATREVTTSTTCVGSDKYWLTEYQVSYNSGVTWVITGTSATTLIERDNAECENAFKISIETNGGQTIEIPCDGSSAYTGSETYEYKDSMVRATIGDCVSAIDEFAFSLRHNLSSIIIPNSVISIGRGAFISTNLSSITLPSRITVINDATFQECISLRDILIPEGVTSIGTQAFSDCTRLSSVTIPDSVTSIGQAAFANCSGLTSIEIPSSVLSIGGTAFADCSRLISVVIPNSVTSIGGSVFSNCLSLTSVTILATTPPTLLGMYAFSNTNDCPIFVPAQSVEAYKNAKYWRAYASRIQAIP